jgi:hypothetical protein
MKNVFYTLLAVFLILPYSRVFSQSDSLLSWKSEPAISLSGNIDVFYVYDFNKPSTKSRQSFLYSYNRHNEFNLNQGMVKLNVAHAKYRGNFALHAGTYVQDNYAAEPRLLQNIFEANVGLTLNKKSNLWIDAGIFSSHIGFESAIASDNLTLTRSLLAENSPYFLAGAKLSYLPNENWELTTLIVNGWQRIQRVEGNSLPSFGTQVVYKPSSKAKFNWSTFIGTDNPDSTRCMRYFSNLYGQFQATEKLQLIAGFDIGMQQSFKGSSSYKYWMSPVFIAQFAFNERWKSAIRAEYYQDKAGIIIPKTSLNGFQTTGLSLNVDYAPISLLLCRIEGRWMHSKDDIFANKASFSRNNFIIGASVALKFSKTFN